MLTTSTSSPFCQVKAIRAGDHMMPSPGPLGLAELTTVEQEMSTRTHPVCKDNRKPIEEYASEGHVALGSPRTPQCWQRISFGCLTRSNSPSSP